MEEFMTQPAVDITNPRTLEGATDQASGTGIYWFTDGSGKMRQLFVPYIKREDAEQIAGDLDTLPRGNVDAYRWVPESFQDGRTLIQAKSGGLCRTDNDCVNPACRCISGECKRTW
jgi:hypothetical protein